MNTLATPVTPAERAQAIQAAVVPFAQLVDSFAAIAPPQEAFDTLAELYTPVYDHPDFYVPHGYEPRDRFFNRGIIASLPFQLALGVHPASRRPFEREDVVATYNQYTQVTPSFGAEGFVRTEDVQHGRARSALSRAIVLAASTDDARTRTIEGALTTVRALDLLSGREVRLLRRTIDLIGD